MSPGRWAYNTRNRRSYLARLKSRSMETLFQFFDNVEDAIVAMALRLRRVLTRRPKERRRVARTPMVKSQDEGPLQAESGRSNPTEENKS